MPQAGDTIRALDFPPGTEAEEFTDITGISSTTYVPGSPACETTFVAGTSGAMEIAVNGRIFSDGTNRIWLSYELYEGASAAGTLLAAGSDNRSIGTKVNGTEESQGMSKIHTGLAVGATHFVRTVHRVAGGTAGAVTHRRISVNVAHT